MNFLFSFHYPGPLASSSDDDCEFPIPFNEETALQQVMENEERPCRAAALRASAANLLS